VLAARGERLTVLLPVQEQIAAGGEHNKKLTGTPHRLNRAQRFLNDLLTRRMQSGRMPTEPRPLASPPCTHCVLGMSTFCTRRVHRM
jgi:hypothetical protein